MSMPSEGDRILAELVRFIREVEREDKRSAGQTQRGVRGTLARTLGASDQASGNLPGEEAELMSIPTPVTNSKWSIDVTAFGELVVHVKIPIAGASITGKVTATKEHSRQLARMILAGEKIESEEARQKEQKETEK